MSDRVYLTLTSNPRSNSNPTTQVSQLIHEPLAVSLRGRDGGATGEFAVDGQSPALRSSSGGGSKQYVSVAENQRGEIRETDIAPALSTGGGKPGSGYSAVRDGAAIRRLTPTERERLMGAPDGWTLDRGPSLADAANTYPSADRCAIDPLPDGRREAASGDGVAVPCAEWIGHRIMSYEARNDQ